MEARTRSRGPEAPSPVLSSLLCAVVVLAVLLAAWDTTGASAAAVPVAHGAQDGDHGTGSDTWMKHEAPDPVRVHSDAVDITSEMIPLGKGDQGRLEVPDDAHTAGWWTGRANPGERGPAVIVGHVDSREGPGAFWELPELEEGDRVTVDREDGSSVHWRVDRVERHLKDEFPTEAVYGDTDEPTLRLVTCSGFFDPETRSYDENTIVFFALDDEQHVVSQHVGTPDAPGGPRSASAESHGPELASGRVLASALEPVAGDEERAVPIALAVLSLLAASGAVGREWCRQR